MFPWWKLSREVNDGERPAYRFGEVGRMPLFTTYLIAIQ